MPRGAATGSRTGSGRAAVAEPSWSTVYALRPGRVFASAPGGSYTKPSLGSFSFGEFKGVNDPTLMTSLLGALEQGVSASEFSKISGESVRESKAQLDELCRAGVVRAYPRRLQSGESRISVIDVTEQISQRLHAMDTSSPRQGFPLAVALRDLTNSKFGRRVELLGGGMISLQGRRAGDRSNHTPLIVRGSVSKLPVLLQINHQRVLEKLPTLYVIDDGDSVIMLHSIPNESPCLEDTFLFREMNSLHSISRTGVKFTNPPAIVSLFGRPHAMSSIADGLIATIVVYELLYRAVSGEGLIAGKILEVNLTDLEMTVSNSLWNPRCGVCSSSIPFPARIPSELK